jgi:hypothetical protein
MALGLETMEIISSLRRIGSYGGMLGGIMSKRLYAMGCSIDKNLLEQELEYLWDDSDSAGKTYEIHLGKISRNPIVKSKIAGKYFALPWSVIIKLALAKGIDK